MGARQLHHPVAAQSAGSRRLLQESQPDAGSEGDPLNSDGEPGDGGEQSVEDPGAPAPVGDSEEGGGVEQESPDLLHGACTNHSELLGSAHVVQTLSTPHVGHHADNDPLCVTL